MKLKGILATAAAMGSVAQGKTSIQQQASNKNTVTTIDKILNQVDNYVAKLQGIKDKVIEAIESREEKGPLLAMTFENEVLYGNLMKNEFVSKAAQGMRFSVWGQNGRLWGINADRQICYLDTKEEGSDWVVFWPYKGWKRIAPYGNAMVAAWDRGITYFPNLEAPKTHRQFGGGLDTLSWDGKHICGAVESLSACWCRPFDGNPEASNSPGLWMRVAASGVADCIADGDRVIAVKKIDGNLRMQASPIKADTAEWEDIDAPGAKGTYIGALVAHGKFAAGIGARNMLYYDEQNSEGNFGMPTSAQTVDEGYLKLAVTDQQLLAPNANKIVSSPLEEGPLVALSMNDEEVLFGNLETKKFSYGGAFASKFAAFGPNGILWGVDQSGNIGFLDTKVKAPWLKSKHFASGNFSRLTAHKNGLVALDGQGFAKVVYFPDITDATKRKELPGKLNTVSWDGVHLCGATATRYCFCAHFEGSEWTEWSNLSSGALDCFPFGKHVLIHKMGSLDLYAKSYTGEGTEIKVTPAGENGRYKHVAVSGDYLAVIKANDELHVVKSVGGKFGVSQNVRKVSGSTTIAVYDSVTEEGNGDLAATHHHLEASSHNQIVNVSLKAGGLVALPSAGKDVIYGNLETKTFGKGGTFGSKFATFGPDGMLWGIDQSGNIGFLDTKSKDMWQQSKLFASGDYTRVTAHKHGLVALDKAGKIIYFSDITDATKQRVLPGGLSTVTWDGVHLCGVNVHGYCFCAHFEGSEWIGWTHLSSLALDCFPFGTHTLVHKKSTKALYARSYSGQGPHLRVTPSGASGQYQHVAVSGNYLAGIKGNDDLHVVKSVGGKFGVSQSIRKVSEPSAISVYDAVTEEGNGKLAATHYHLEASSHKQIVNVSLEAGGLVAVPSAGKDVVYGNLETKKFGNGGAFGSKFATFGPDGMLWGIDQSGNIGFLDTKSKDMWQQSKLFASGDYTRVTAHKHGLVALDKAGKIIYFSDITDATKQRVLPGGLSTVTWDGVHLCGVNVHGYCFCAHFEGSEWIGWTHLSSLALDCFPFGTHTLVHKKSTKALYAKSYSGQGPHLRVTPSGASGQYQHVAVSGNYLAGIKGDDDLHVVKSVGGKFGVSQSIRKVSEPSAIAVYDAVTEEGNGKLAATHYHLEASSHKQIVNVSLESGGLVAMPSAGKDVVYGNLETKTFGNGGTFGSKFATFGPNGMLWGIDQSGNIGFLDTKAKDIWQQPKLFASGDYIRVTAHEQGVVALNGSGRIIYFSDITDATKKRVLPGVLSTVTWDGVHLCGVSVNGHCFCAHFEGSKWIGWTHLSSGALDCFPFGTHTLVHKRSTKALYARSYSGEGPHIQVTPAGESGQYEHVAVSGNYLAGIKGIDDLHVVKSVGGKFGVSQSIRKVSEPSAIAVYDAVTEEGNGKLAATHSELQAAT